MIDWKQGKCLTFQKQMSKIVISNINNIIQLVLPKQLVIFSKSILQYYKSCRFFGLWDKKKSAYFRRSRIKSPGPQNKRTARSTRSANSLLSERTGEMCWSNSCRGRASSGSVNLWPRMCSYLSAIRCQSCSHHLPLRARQRIWDLLTWHQKTYQPQALLDRWV